jgi:hypothetical protein
MNLFDHPQTHKVFVKFWIVHGAKGVGYGLFSYDTHQVQLKRRLSFVMGETLH